MALWLPDCQSGLQQRRAGSFPAAHFFSLLRLTRSGDMCQNTAEACSATHRQIQSPLFRVEQRKRNERRGKSLPAVL